MMAIDGRDERRFCIAMKTRITINRSGRITLPKSLLSELRLEPGDALEAVFADDRIILRRPRETSALSKEHRVWVLHTGEPLPSGIDDLRERISEERDVVHTS